MSFRTGPPPPTDHALRTEIERLAQYVAQNGPASEQQIRQANYNNPAYKFLFSGEGSTYYQFCLARAINNLRQIAECPLPPPVLLSGRDVSRPPPASNAPPPNPDSEIASLKAQLTNLREQISQSERNLKAQRDSIPGQKTFLVEQKFHSTEEQRIKELMTSVGLDIENFLKKFEPLSSSRSKDTISNIKHWIYDNCDTDQKREIVLTFFLQRCRSAESTDDLKLHILYLINDWAYYCQKQHKDNIRQTLSRYVPKLYAHAEQSGKLREKLAKLVSIWENGRYFDDNCMKQLSNPSMVMSMEHNTMLGIKSKLGAEIEADLHRTFEQYKKQHLEFENHVLTQIANIQQQIEAKSRAPQVTPLFAQKFGNKMFTDDELKPKGKYYELPAGMMVKLIRPPDLTFAALDPDHLRLPPPNDMSDRLLAALDQFYAIAREPPNPAEIDSDGWDLNGLKEFYALKDGPRKELEEKLKQDGKTLEDVIENRQRRYSDNSSSSSSSSSSTSSRSSSRSRSASPSQARLRSESPEARPSFSAPSSTSFGGPSFMKPDTSLNKPLPSVNKGAQLLQKMGWSGGGLGADGRGRAEPIQVDGPRDFQDQFRGVGSKPDEYDQFRKQMSQRFRK